MCVQAPWKEFAVGHQLLGSTQEVKLPYMGMLTLAGVGTVRLGTVVFTLSRLP